MTVPRAVQEQADAADAALKAAFEAQESPEPTPEVETQGEVPVIPEPEPPPPVEDENSQTWKQRYSTLQGMYNKDLKELPALKDENTALRRRMEQVSGALAAQQDLVKELQAKVEEARVKPAVHTAQPSAIAQEDEAALKEELGDAYPAVARAIEAIAERKVAEVRAEVQQTAKEAKAYKAETAQEKAKRYQADVLKGVPDFDAVNYSKDFNAWLDEQASPLSPETRRSILANYHNTLDANGVIKIFKAFKDEKKPAPPSMEEEIAPGPSAGTTPKDTGTQAQVLINKWMAPGAVQKFYSDVTRGAYRDKPDLAAQYEKEINYVLSLRQGQEVPPSPGVANRNAFGAMPQ